MKRPLVTVITVTLNAERTLERAIRSVMAQTYDRIEYIVIDGGSRDETLRIVDRYREHISDVVVEEDEGVSDAFNKGLRRASGEYVGLLNADDEYLPGAVELAVEAFEREKAGVVVGSIVRRYADGREEVRTSRPGLMYLDMSVQHCGSFVRRDVYEEHGYYRLDLKYAMDYEMALRLHLRGVKFAVLDEVLAVFSMEGVSARRWEMAIYEVYRSKVINGFSPLTSYLYYLAFWVRKRFLRFLPRVYFKEFWEAVRKRS